MSRDTTVIYSNMPCNVSIKAIDSGGMDTLKMAGNGFVFLGLDIVLYPSGIFSVTEFQWIRNKKMLQNWEQTKIPSLFYRVSEKNK